MARGDCAHFVSLIDIGKAVFRHGSDPDEVDRRLEELILADTAPADRSTTLYVSSADLTNPEVREYLGRELGKNLHPTVTVFDPETFTLVDDFAVLDAARNTLDADVNLSPGTVVPDTAGPGVMRVDDDSVRRLVPASTAEQRQALRTLAGDSAPAGPDKLARYLDQAPPGLTDGADPVPDHSAHLGVPHALFGDRPGRDLSTILDAPGRVSLADVQRASGGELTSLSLPAVVNELEGGRASAALVHGWPPGRDVPQMRWLYRDDGGTVRWGIKGTPAFDRDGSADPRTRLLEQPHTTVLLFDPEGAALSAPDPAPTPVSDPTPAGLHLAVRSRLSGNSILHGPWDDDFVGPRQNQVMTEAGRLDGPNVVVNVRRGEPVDGRSTLETALGDALHTTLRNNPSIPFVLATEANDQLTWLATQQYRRSSVHPVADGWKTLWEVTSPTGQRDRFPELGPEVFQRATTLSGAAPDPVSPDVRALLASSTMKEAEQFFRDRVDQVRTPEAADQVVRMVRQFTDHSQGADRLGDGAIRDSPFFVPDVITPAFATVLTTAVNAAGDPALAGVSPIAPRNQWLAEAISPPTQRADENLLFGYLTDRPLDLSTPVGDYLTGLLWLREMISAMLSTATGLTPRAGLTVLRAKGELDGERAARTPGQPEHNRAHAVIAENFFALVTPDQVDVTVSKLSALLDAIDCLSGEDRVAWYYVIKHMGKDFPHVQEALNRFRDRISDCVQ